MEEVVDSQYKRERPAGYGHPPHHMASGEAQNLHNYHHSAPQATPMQPEWAPAPSPYGGGHDQRPPTDHASHHPPPPPSQYPYQQAPAPAQGPYHSAPEYSRHNSVSVPSRSPPSAHPQHYSLPHVNGNSGPPPPEGYYTRPDYPRQPYPPSTESPAHPVQAPPLHVQTTGHDIMTPQPPSAQHPPPSPAQTGYHQQQAQHPPSAHPQGPYAPWPPHAQPPWGFQDQQQRRKPVRAAQACDSCRQRKAKCDEGRPECGHCKDNGIRCTYRDVPPQKQEKQMLQIGEKVEVLTERLDGFGDRFASQDKTLAAQGETLAAQGKMLTAILNAVTAGHESKSGSTRHAISTPMAKSRSSHLVKEDSRSDVQANVLGHVDINHAFLDSSAIKGTQQTTITEISDAAPKTSRGPMGASDLLTWPVIRELVPPNIPVTYVMDGEVERGLLRLYGCGEGEDKGDGHDGAPSPTASHISDRIKEDGSTSSPSGAWGTGHLPQREGGPDRAHDHRGGVTPGGELLLEQHVVDRYVTSYKKHMHILHPFLDLRVLNKMVLAFKRKHSWDHGMNRHGTAGVKRKREDSESPNSTTEDYRQSTPIHNGGPRSHTRTRAIEHSVSNAIILLVIALGKICDFEDALPGPPRSRGVLLHQTSRTKINGAPDARHGYGDLPPVSSSFPSSSAPASPYPLHMNGTSAPVYSNVLGGKNMDVIPGLAYFAKAADILGELPGGIDVSHIQANLLAGLYMGQLARVIPSHWYISNACRACQILIRSADYKAKTMPVERRNLINFAFWSCLQLESDILAEVDIPASGIVQKESSMIGEVPTALTILDPDAEESDMKKTDPQEFLQHYSNQIQLRRTINDAVHNIYNDAREHQKPSRLMATLDHNLEGWRKLLQAGWNWDDDNHMSDDINHARMRAKYYGAKYIISRPALQYILAMSDPATPHSHPSESPAAVISETASPAMAHQNHMTDHRYNNMYPPGRYPVEDYLIEACQRCVKAAIKSTTAFDAVPNRLIITNIVGTAHAQFGNLLVLAAVYNSRNPVLNGLIDRGTLSSLLNRTIAFLEERAAISPALAKDAIILRHVQGQLFHNRGQRVYAQEITSAQSSFSSAH